MQHYAKPVMYTVGTFIPKNMDTCPNEMLAVLASSVHNQKCSILSAALLEDDSAEETLHHIDRTSVTFESHGNPLVTLRSPSSSPSLPPSPPPDSDADASDDYFSAEMKRKLQSFEAPSSTVPVRPRPPKPGINRKGRNETVSSTFVRQMAALCSHLQATNCTFIRCIKPNASMAPGLFEHKFVMDQVRVLGIIQTCEVLKQGMPARLTFAEIGAMYRNNFPDRERAMVQRLSPAEFTQAVALVLGIPTGNFQLGRTRVFFTSSNLASMEKMASVDMSTAAGDRLVAGVVSFHIRRLWKFALTKVYTQVVFCLHLKSCRRKHDAALSIQSCWLTYVRSARFQRRLKWRTLWKRAIYYTICSNILLENYTLIREANEMRLRAEAAAEESMRALRELESEVDSRRRARSASGAGGAPQLFRADSAGAGLPPVLEAPGDEEFMGESEVDLIIAEDAVRAQAEMRALAAASSLATVSVCLFRWTKIRLFMAFEKWHEMCLLTDENRQADALPRARVLSMLERTRMGADKRGKYTNGSEDEDDELEGRRTSASSKDSDGKGRAVVVKCFECQQRTARTWCDSCYQVIVFTAALYRVC